MSTEAKEKAAPKKRGKKMDWSKVAMSDVPSNLMFLSVGAKVRMSWGTALVSKVTNKGLPLELDYRDADGVKHMARPFVLKDYVGRK